MRRLTRYFFEGLLVLVPGGLTIYFVYHLFLRIDQILKLPVPGAGFAITILGVTLIGFLASNILTKRLLGLVDKIFVRLPFVKMVYTAIKDLVGAFVSDKKGFNRPVLVALSDDRAVNAVGFVTQDSMEDWGMADHVSVYMPQSYNFAGYLILVPKERVTPLHVESGDVMTFIVSGGVSRRRHGEDS